MKQSGKSKIKTVNKHIEGRRENSRDLYRTFYHQGPSLQLERYLEIDTQLPSSLVHKLDLEHTHGKSKH